MWLMLWEVIMFAVQYDHHVPSNVFGKSYLRPFYCTSKFVRRRKSELTITSSDIFFSTGTDVDMEWAL